MRRIWIALALVLCWMNDALAFSSTPYLPLAAGNSWTYQYNGTTGTRYVLAGSQLVNGVPTSVLQYANGDQMFLTNDASGIRQHRSYTASEYIPGYGYVSEIDTLSPPFTFATAETSVGSYLPQSGTLTADIGGASFTFNYTGYSTVVGYETVTTPAGVYNALKIMGNISYSGTVYGTPVSGSQTQTYWVVPNLGVVRNDSTVDGVTTSALLTASNLLAPIAGLDKTSLNFGTVALGSSSASQSVTLSNTGNAALTLSTIDLSGDFSQTNNCGVSLAAGSTCTFNVTFTPTGAGSRTGSLTLYDNASGSPHAVSLSGTATATYIGSASPTGLNFGSLPYGNSSDYQTVTFRNTGTGILSSPVVSTTGSFFTINGCQPSPVAPGASCSILVGYQAQGAASDNGTLTISTNAGNSPQTVSLAGTTTFALSVTNSGGGTVTSAPAGINCGNTCSAAYAAGTTVTLTPTPDATHSFSGWDGDCSGTGTCQVAMNGPHFVSATFAVNTPAVSLDRGRVDFAAQTVGTSSSPATVVLSNTGTGALAISGISASGDFSQSNNCGVSLSAGANCSIQVSFSPTATGDRSGTLTVTDDAYGSPHQVSLFGTGQQAALNASVVTGWNLLGNGTTGTVDVAATFGDPAQVISVWKWLPGGSGQWAFYTPTQADGGAAFAAGNGYAFLTSIGPGEGFWIKASTAFSATLAIGGPLATSQFRDGSGASGANILPTGWSLVAVGDNPSPRIFANGILSALATPPAPGTPSATTLNTLWAWRPADATHTAAWYFYAPSLDNSGGLADHIASHGYLDFTSAGKSLDPATGFWVNHP